MTTLVSRPTLTGTMRESPEYNVLGVGLTDRIFLLGHADLPLNDPYQILSVQDAVNKLGVEAVGTTFGDTFGDTFESAFGEDTFPQNAFGVSDCPLLRATLEAYYAGARDIWLVAVAPMSEYEPDIAKRLTSKEALGNKTFYEKYQERLTATYSLLESWDDPQIVVPVEASFYNTGVADFFTPLATHCSLAFETTGVIRIGILGTRGVIDQTAVNALVADTRSNTLDGKFTMVVVGDGTINLKEMPTAYSTSVATVAAGTLATLSLDRGLTSRLLPNVLGPSQGDFTKAQLVSLTEKKFNPILRTSKGRRGVLFQTMLLTDNTMGQTGTDFWSMLQMRLVAKTADRIRALGNRSLGTIGFAQFKQDVEKYLLALVIQDSIRNYDLLIYRDSTDLTRAYVDYTLQPYFGLREISLTVEVGPGV